MRKADVTVSQAFEEMHNSRNGKIQKAIDNAAATIPSLMPETVRTRPYTPYSENREQHPYSSLPARGVSQLAAKATSALLPMTNQPFVEVSLRPSDVAALAGDDAALKNMQRASKLIQDEVYHTLARSNLRQALYLHMKHLAVIGDGMIMQDGLNFEVHRLDNYVLTRDMLGEPLYAIVRQYARLDEIPEGIREAVVSDGDDVVTRTDGDMYPLYTELTRQDSGSWESVQYIGRHMVPGSELMYEADTFPYYFARWNHDPYDAYGVSLVEENYGDLLAASAVRQTLLDGYAIATMGFIGVTPGSLTVAMVDRAQSWDALPVDGPNDLNFIQPNNVGALAAAEQMDARLTQELRRIFLMDVSAELTHERTTATQVIMAAEELNRATGGLLSTFDRTTLRPIVMTTINNLVDQGVFDAEVVSLVRSGDITIDVKSGVDALGRESQYRNVATFIAEIGQFIPGALNSINQNAFIRWAAQARGIPDIILKTDQQMEEDAQAALQQRANESLADQVGATGGALVEQAAQLQPPQ